MWAQALIFDAGDALSDMPALTGDRIANTNATAELIVDYFNAEGLRAQNIGDRDLGLGRAALGALAKRAKYPFITTNIVDAQSGQPLFAKFALFDVGEGIQRTKVAVFGLVTDRTRPAEAEKLKIVPPIDALRPAIAEAKTQGATVFIVLSQLMARDEAAISEALPEIQLFLGGDFTSMSSDPETAGKSLSFAGSQKGKHLGFLKLTFADPNGFGAYFADPRRRDTLERRRDDAQRRVDNYQKLLAERATAPPPSPPGGPETKQRANVPTDVYERQLASARAELQLVTDELTTLGAATPGSPRNGASLELIPLGRDIVDEPALKAQIETFRKTWPDPTPGH